MIACGTNLVTIVELGSHWCAVKIDANQNIEYISNSIERKVSFLAAKKFAYEHNLPYVDKAIKSHLPVMAPGVCVTCDPIRDVEARLSLCVGAHKTLTEQVDGWNLPLCPGRIICLKYERMKFAHVKTIDVQSFVAEYYSFKNKWIGWQFNAKLFCRLFLEQMKRWFGASK